MVIGCHIGAGSQQKSRLTGDLDQFLRQKSPLSRGNQRILGQIHKRVQYESYALRNTEGLLSASLRQGVSQ